MVMTSQTGQVEPGGEPQRVDGTGPSATVSSAAGAEPALAPGQTQVLNPLPSPGGEGPRLGTVEPSLGAAPPSGDLHVDVFPAASSAEFANGRSVPLAGADFQTRPPSAVRGLLGLLAPRQRESEASTPGAQKEPGVAKLVGSLLGDVSTLLRQEVLLAKQEVTDGLKTTMRASVVLVIGAVLGAYGFGFLLATIASLIATVLPHWIAIGIVAVGLLLLAGLFAAIGAAKLKKSKIAPERAAAELRETAKDVKEEIRWGTRPPSPPVK